MVRGEQKKTVFIGPTTISIGNMLIDGKTVLFKKIPSKPLIDKWIPVMGNIDSVPKEIRKLYIPSVGETDMEVEIYWCDLQFRGYSYTIHPEYVSQIKHLTNENAMLKLKLNKMMNLVYDNSNDDLGKKKLKDEIEWLNKIKSPYLGNEGGGIGSPFGGGFSRF